MSAGRPGGWDVVDLDDDPTPGEVSGIRSLSRGYGSIAEAAGEAHRILVRILNDGATASWVGAAGDAFRAKVDDDFPGQVDKCATSYGLARDALAGFAGRVDDAQVKADTNLAKAKTAAEDLASAKDAVAQATGGASGAAQTFQEQQDLYDQYKHQDPPAGVEVPSAAQLRSLSAASQQAQAQANQAQGDLSDAQSRLDAAKRMVLEAQGDYEDAEDRAVRTLEDAYDAAVPEDSWWVKVIHSKAWHVIVAVVTVLVIVAAIAAFFVTGPLALILGAVILIGSGIQLLDDAGKFFNGEESGAEFAMAIALTFLPGGKIAKGLEKGVAAATKGIRAGEGAARGARGAEDVAEGAKNVDQSTKEVAEGGGKSAEDASDGGRPRDGDATSSSSKEASEDTQAHNRSDAVDDRPYLDPSSRPSFRKGVADEVYGRAAGSDGIARDPNTGDPLPWEPGTSRVGKWDMGHIPGEKYSEVHARYVRGEMTPKEFRDWYNDPDNYQPELPANNRSHKYE